MRRLVQASLALLVCANVLPLGSRSDSERLYLNGHLLPHKFELIIIDIVIGILLISWQLVVLYLYIGHGVKAAVVGLHYNVTVFFDAALCWILVLRLTADDDILFLKRVSSSNAHCAASLFSEIYTCAWIALIVLRFGTFCSAFRGSYSCLFH